jgi:hypothetical protein
VTNDAYYKIGILILALCAITWMFTSNSWGEEFRERGSRAWDGSPGVCSSCHKEQANEMHASSHHQWQGEALYRTSGPLIAEPSGQPTLPGVELCGLSRIDDPHEPEGGPGIQLEGLRNCCMQPVS